MGAQFRLTHAQARAVLWLPADGSWTTDAPGRLAQALNSASFRHFTQGEWGDFGPKGGRLLRWRLTDKGVEARKSLEPAHDH